MSNTARRFLRDARYGPDNPLPPLNIAFSNKANFQAVAEDIRGMWHLELRADMRLFSRKLKTLFADRRKGSYDILLSTNWVSKYPYVTHIF